MCVVSGEREAHANTADDLREALSTALARGCKRVLIDLQESEHVDPLVLGAILGTQRRLEHFGGELAVACASARGFADIERVGVGRHMTTFDDRSDAFKWLGAGMQEVPRRAR